MRSKASIKSHPLHPMLVAFPIAFLFGSLAADVLGRQMSWATMWTTGAYMSIAALVTGLVAAIPGLIDYFTVVPPNSSAKDRATWHMAVNGSALVAVALGWFFRDGRSLEPGLGTLAFEAGSVALVTWGGWMGAVLVYRNQIGVDHRYAQAGKWREEMVEETSSEKIRVASADELKTGQMKLLHVRGRRIVLAQTEEGYTAFDDRCTHKGGSLADGALVCGKVQCPWHGSQFDVRTGSVEAGPAEKPIATYEVEESGGQVWLMLPKEEHARQLALR